MYSIASCTVLAELPLAEINPDDPIIDQIRRYMTGGFELQRLATAFAEDLADHPAARRLLDRHFRYVMTVVERLVTEGIEQGELREVTPSVVAGAIAGSSLYMIQPDIGSDFGVDVSKAGEEMLDFLLASLPK